MNRNVQILIGILVLIVLGAGALLMFKNSSKTPVATQSSKTTVSSNQPASSKTLKDLIASGKAQKCTFKNKDTSAEAVEGTTYISSGKMRGDFNTSVAGKTMMMHMILNDKTSYTWVEGQTNGYKTAYDVNNTPKPSGTSQSRSVDLNKFVDYNCTDWSADDSMLTPPTNIKFAEMGGMMGPTGATGTNSTGTKTAAPQNNCAACDYLSGDAKTQCRTQLNCQ